MRPDQFGPDAVRAEREEAYRERAIRSGYYSSSRDCAGCGDLVPLRGPDLCDHCLTVSCQTCEGRRRVADLNPRTGRDEWEWCATCGGEGLVSFHEAKKLHWKVTR